MIFKMLGIMKKIISILLSASLVFTLATSCSKSETSPKEVNGDQLVKVTLVAGNPQVASGTKTEIDGTTPYWSVGDKIGVSTGAAESNYQFTTNIAAPSTTAEFTGTTVSGDLYAYYPFTSNGVSASGAKVDIPLNQTPTASSFDPKADVMVAKQFSVDPAGTTVSNLQFKRLSAIVKIVLKDNSASTLLAGQHPSVVSMEYSEQNLVGRVYVELANQQLGELYYNQSKVVNATYTNATQFEIDNINAAYVIVYPQVLEAGATLTISAETEDYAIAKAITIPAGGIDLKAGKITTLNIGLSDANITPAATGDALPFIDDMSWADNGSSDSSTDISTSIETESAGLYTAGSKAYKGIGGLKLGTSSYPGAITTKALDLSGQFYIEVVGEVYGTDPGTLVITVDETEVLNEAFASVNYVNLAAGTFTNKSKVTIGTSAKRGRIYSVKIKSGEYVPAPAINVTSSNPIAAANTEGVYTIEYTISNPSVGTSLTASTTETWITDIDCSVSGKVSFIVGAQAAAAPARNGVITLHYTNAADVDVTVNQAAGAGAGGGSDDFYTVSAASSYGNRSTTAGWTAVNTAVINVNDAAASDNNHKCSFTINGKTTAVGVITSPSLSGGIATLSLRYQNTFSEANGASFRIDIIQKNSLEEDVVVWTQTVTRASMTQSTGYSASFNSMNVTGSFKIVITNLSPTGSTSNKDRVSIYDIQWTGYTGA